MRSGTDITTVFLLGLGRRAVPAALAVAALASAIILLWVMSRPSDLEGRSVLDAAYAYHDGGGYTLKGTGAPKTIRHKGQVILDQGIEGTHCVGFTFSVMWDVAEILGWFNETPIDDIIALQREWFNATPESAMKGCVFAMCRFGLGRELNLADAQPGDFLQIQRLTKKTAHQGIFLDWVKNTHGIIGIRYRGSQGETDGIGDHTEYFLGTGLPGASLDPEHVFVGRLFRQPHR